MNYNTFIKPSNINGLGLFAKKNILKGEEIIQGVADYSNHIDEWIKYNKESNVISYAFHNGYCMINHCDTPNTERSEDELKVFATKKISAGEEITEDYWKLKKEGNPFAGFCMDKFVFDCINKNHEEVFKEMQSLILQS